MFPKELSKEISEQSVLKFFLEDSMASDSTETLYLCLFNRD